MNADASVRRHLLGVARALRAEAAADPSRAAERSRMLDRLEAYARAGRFPHNDRGAAPRPRPHVPSRAFDAPGARTPRFRDAAGTWCAVGHLVVGTDPALAASIAGRFDDRWVGEMREPALLAWAERHGLSVADLEWIQPAYFCDYMEHCDRVDLDPPPALSSHVCTGADPAVSFADAAVEWCGDCDGNVTVWVWLHNRGNEPTGDVKVQLYDEEPSGDLAVVDEIVESALNPGSVRLVGPFSIGGLPDGVRVVADDDCDANDNMSEPEAWRFGVAAAGGLGGWALPRRCAARAACHEPGCGCGSAMPVPAVGALLAASLGAMTLRRRRTA